MEIGVGRSVSGGLRKRVLDHLSNGTYDFTPHALESMGDDELSCLDVVKSLKGARESSTEHENTVSLGWTYAFRGSLDGDEIKIVVSFEGDESDELMLVINAYKG